MAAEVARSPQQQPTSQEALIGRLQKRASEGDDDALATLKMLDSMHGEYSPNPNPNPNPNPKEPGRLFWQRCGPAWARHPCGVLLGRAESVSACLTCIPPLRVWHVLLRPSSCRWFRPRQVCAHTDMPSMYTHVVRAGVFWVLWSTIDESTMATMGINGDGDDDLLHGARATSSFADKFDFTFTPRQSRQHHR